MNVSVDRLHNTPGAHYESAATRMYAGGRTETIRSCSIESIEFAKAMLNPQIAPKEKLTKLQNAINGHKDYTVQVRTTTRAVCDPTLNARRDKNYHFLYRPLTFSKKFLVLIGAVQYQQQLSKGDRRPWARSQKRYQFKLSFSVFKTLPSSWFIMTIINSIARRVIMI